MRTLGSHHRNKEHLDSKVKQVRALLIISTLYEQLGWERAAVEKSLREKTGKATVVLTAVGGRQVALE